MRNTRRVRGRVTVGYSPQPGAMERPSFEGDVSKKTMLNSDCME